MYRIEPKCNKESGNVMSKATLSRRKFLQLAAATTASVAGYMLPGLPIRAHQNPRQWRTTGTDVPDLVSFDKIMQKFMQERNIPGGALAVTRQGRLVFARGYNWSDDDNETVEPTSLFRIASLTKPFTSAAVMVLV